MAGTCSWSGRMKEMEGKVSPGATLIMMGLDNGLYYGEQEDGGRALPKQGEDKKSTWKEGWRWVRGNRRRGCWGTACPSWTDTRGTGRYC